MIKKEDHREQVNMGVAHVGGSGMAVRAGRVAVILLLLGFGWFWGFFQQWSPNDEEP